ncbi:MAG: class I SAM-dependent methyltransferase [Myxococcota bacterium]
MTAKAAFWDRIAESYAARPLPNPEATERKLAIVRGLMEPDHRVLDIGCGTGTIVMRLHDAAGEIHGLDISAAMVEFGRDKAEKAGADHVHFHVGPFDEQFDVFGDASLDGVLAFNIVHLVPDADAAMRQIFRMLRPGGYFVQSTAFLAGTWMPLWLVIPVMRWFGRAPDHVAMLDKATVIDQMRHIGFVDIEEHDVGSSDNSGFLVARKPDGSV